MEIDIPFTQHNIDTSDGASGVAEEGGKATAGFVLLFAIVTFATLVFNRARSLAGVDQPSVPGV